MVFDRIYRDNLWNGVESRSGPGSGDAATAKVRDQVVALVEELGIASVLDFGCGDSYWTPDLPGYVGYDPTAEAIQRARTNHPERRYTTRRPKGPFDLVILRDVLQHLPLKIGLEKLTQAKASGRYLLASTYVGSVNLDIEAGDAYSPDLTQSPFSMPWPDRLIFDGYHYHHHDTDRVRDPSKHLGLWVLTT